MADTPFDPLNVIRRLTEVGIPQAQAEVHAEAFAQICQFDPDAPVSQAFLYSQLMQLRSELTREIQRAIAVIEKSDR